MCFCFFSFSFTQYFSILSLQLFIVIVSLFIWDRDLFSVSHSLTQIFKADYVLVSKQRDLNCNSIVKIAKPPIIKAIGYHHVFAWKILPILIYYFFVSLFFFFSFYIFVHHSHCYSLFFNCIISICFVFFMFREHEPNWKKHARFLFYFFF